MILAGPCPVMALACAERLLPVVLTGTGRSGLTFTLKFSQPIPVPGHIVDREVFSGPRGALQP